MNKYTFSFLVGLFLFIFSNSAFASSEITFGKA